MKVKYNDIDKKIVVSLRLNKRQLDYLDKNIQNLSCTCGVKLSRSEYILFKLNVLHLNKFDYSIANIRERKELARRKKMKF